MECNKDEAIRAKGIAEKKLLQMDIAAAKKFALIAQNLFPELDGLSQFLEVVNLYLASENKINGVPDWYGILGVDPHSADDLIKKQYKKKALAFHPDKNPSVGADGAFKHVSAAWAVLSDKEKKREYDTKINIRAPHHSVFAGNSQSGNGLNGDNEATGSGRKADSSPRHPRKRRNMDENQRALIRKARKDVISQLDKLNTYNP